MNTPTVKQLITRLRLQKPTAILNAPSELREEVEEGNHSIELSLDLHTGSESVVLFAHDSEVLSGLFKAAESESAFDPLFYVVIPRFSKVIDRQHVKEAAAEHEFYIVTEVKPERHWMAYRIRPKSRVR